MVCQTTIVSYKAYLFSSVDCPVYIYSFLNRLTEYCFRINNSPQRERDVEKVIFLNSRNIIQQKGNNSNL